MSRLRILVAVLAGIASTVLLVIMLVVHTIGSEIDGVVVAALAVAAGAGGLVSLARGGAWRRLVLVLWLVVAAGGGLGYLEHASEPVPGRPVLDDRPRPPLAPLLFTVIGLAGAATVVRVPAR